MINYTISISDNTNATKHLIGLAKELAKNNKHVIVKLATKADLEAMEDKVIGDMIDDARKSPEISEDEVMQALEP